MQISSLETIDNLTPNDILPVLDIDGGNNGKPKLKKVVLSEIISLAAVAGTKGDKGDTGATGNFQIPTTIKTVSANSDYFIGIDASGAFYRITKDNLLAGLSSSSNTSNTGSNTGGSTSNTNTVLTFASSGDTNGICYWLGAKNGSWTNPHTSGQLQVSASSFGGSGKPEQIVDRQGGYALYTNNAANSWFSVNFNTYKIQPNYYTIRHDNETGYYLRNWKLQGSNDNINWTDLDTKVNNTTINAPDGWGAFPISGINVFYKILRILQTGPTSTNDNYLVIGELEFYGEVTNS